MGILTKKVPFREGTQSTSHTPKGYSFTAQEKHHRRNFSDYTDSLDVSEVLKKEVQDSAQLSIINNEYLPHSQLKGRALNGYRRVDE